MTNIHRHLFSIFGLRHVIKASLVIAFLSGISSLFSIDISQSLNAFEQQVAPIKAKTISQADWKNKVRPQDFYTTRESANDVLCSKVLNALNETIYTAPKAPKREDYPIVPSWPWFEFMHTQYSVDWVTMYNRNGGKTDDRVIVDLDHDGEKEAVYRRIFSGKGAWFNSLMRTNEFPAVERRLTGPRYSVLQKERYNQDVLTDTKYPVYKTSFKVRIYINLEGLPDGAPEPDFFVRRRSVTGLFEIIEVDGLHYLLVLRSGVPKTPFSVHLLKLNDNINQTRLCRFDSTYLITPTSE